ncbi:DddA-like double-stranded DNA deaminase toxin [Kitasatospora sp. NPDC094016]|uniref:DddA-like double-stranded DNA deaminase toxin n=1 Tax=Kitasatospora sp. NPDC094016 TaxID=3154986 RepID=UPI003323331E
MHNLTVADLHTFYMLAGDTPVLTHNICLAFAKEIMSDLRIRLTSGAFPMNMETNLGPSLIAGHILHYQKIDTFLRWRTPTENPRNWPYPPVAHTETLFARWVKENSIKDADIIINHPKGMCGPPMGCQESVKCILPKGWTMQVWSPGGDTPRKIVGVGPESSAGLD